MDYFDIFRSSGNGIRRVEIDDIEDWINSGLLSLTTIQLIPRGRVALYTRALWRAVTNAPHARPADADADYCNQLDKHLTNLRWKMERKCGSVGGGAGHQILANVASLFLQDMGKRVTNETWANGRRVDVAATDWSWIIECGDTNARPIMDHLYQVPEAGRAERVAIIPFQDDMSLKAIEMHVFRRGPQWTDEKIKEMFHQPIKWK
jgi:hypothetical protein